MQQVPPKCRYMVLHPRRQYLLILSSVSLVRFIWGSLFRTNAYPAVQGPVSLVDRYHHFRNVAASLPDNMASQSRTLNAMRTSDLIQVPYFDVL